eukprot:scaffold94621_cov17-Prasinocladus_malaysianus.AAC.1
MHEIYMYKEQQVSNTTQSQHGKVQPKLNKKGLPALPRDKQCFSICQSKNKFKAKQPKTQKNQTRMPAAIATDGCDTDLDGIVRLKHSLERGAELGLPGSLLLALSPFPVAQVVRKEVLPVPVLDGLYMFRDTHNRPIECPDRHH